MKMNKFILIVILIVANACSTVNIPLENDFDYVHRKKYELHIYDCSNKSAEYLTLLQKSGFNDSRIWTYKASLVKGMNLYGYHAIVEVNGIMLDPTSGGVIKKLAVEYIRKTGKAIEFKDLPQLTKENPSEWKF